MDISWILIDILFPQDGKIKYLNLCAQLIVRWTRVQIQVLGSSNSHFKATWTRKNIHILSTGETDALASTKQMVFQRPQWHVLVNQKPLISIDTVSDKVNQVLMVQEAQHQNLHKELSIPLQSVPVKLLHSYSLNQLKQVSIIPNKTWKSTTMVPEFGPIFFFRIQNKWFNLLGYVGSTHSSESELFLLNSKSNMGPNFGTQCFSSWNKPGLIYASIFIYFIT